MELKDWKHNRKVLSVKHCNICLPDKTYFFFLYNFDILSLDILSLLPCVLLIFLRVLKYDFFHFYRFFVFFSESWLVHWTTRKQLYTTILQVSIWKIKESETNDVTCIATGVGYSFKILQEPNHGCCLLIFNLIG